MVFLGSLRGLYGVTGKLFENSLKLEESLQEKQEHLLVQSIKNPWKEACELIRDNAIKKGQPNTTAQRDSFPLL